MNNHWTTKYLNCSFDFGKSELANRWNFVRDIIFEKYDFDLGEVEDDFYTFEKSKVFKKLKKTEDKKEGNIIFMGLTEDITRVGIIVGEGFNLGVLHRTLVGGAYTKFCNLDNLKISYSRDNIYTYGV